jgi:hypothetical protein
LDIGGERIEGRRLNHASWNDEAAAVSYLFSASRLVFEQAGFTPEQAFNAKDDCPAKGWHSVFAILVRRQRSM